MTKHGKKKQLVLPSACTRVVTDPYLVPIRRDINLNDAKSWTPVGLLTSRGRGLLALFPRHLSD